MRAFLKKRKTDLILIGALLLLFALSRILLSGVRGGGRCRIESNGETVGVYDLSEHRELRIEDPAEGYNIVVIGNGEVFVREASCKDRLCVHQGKIKKCGETLICLPHQMVVTVIE